MGAAAARKLAADGFRVAILSSSGKGEALAGELGGLGVTGSNRSPEDLARLVETVMAKWGRIDAVVNNAGHGPGVRCWRSATPTGSWAWSSTCSTSCASRAWWPRSCRRSGPAPSSTSPPTPPSRPEALFPTSGVFRAGLATFTKVFSDEYAAHNVRMNNVLPGFIDSLPERKSAAPAFRWAATARPRKWPT